MKNILILFLFTLFIFSCCQVSYNVSKYPANTDPDVQTFIIKVYIDKDFTDQQRFTIEQALGNWNYTLNHYVEYQMVNDRIEVDQALVDKVNRDRGLLFIQYSNDDPESGMLARVDDIGGHLVFVMVNRDSLNNTTVIQHEIGHAAPLGLEHNDHSGSLMYPYLVNQSKCIDNVSIDQLVHKDYWMKKQYLNFCEIK